MTTSASARDAFLSRMWGRSR